MESVSGSSAIVRRSGVAHNEAGGQFDVVGADDIVGDHLSLDRVATRPISSNGCATVVSGGAERLMRNVSSKPTTLRSLGIQNGSTTGLFHDPKRDFVISCEDRRRPVGSIK